MASRTIGGFIKFQGIRSLNSSFQLGLGFGPLSASLHSSSSSSSSSNSCWDDEYSLDYEYAFEDDDLDYFDSLIHRRPLPSVDHFIPLLNSVTHMKQFSRSLEFFKHMCAIGVPVNKHTANIAIKCYCRLHDTKQGFTVLGYCFKRGILPDVCIYNTILDGFITEDKTHEAERLFNKFIKNQICDCEPNLVTYNTMVKGLCKIGNNFTAIALLRLMEGRGCKPNVVTYNTIIDSLCNDIITINDALKLFKEMLVHKGIPPTVVTYNSLIYALCKLGRWDEVSKMLKQMQGERISIQVTTFNIIVDALCKQGKIKEAQVVINFMVESGCKYPPDIATYNSLIDGYCLQGEMSEAKTVYDLLAVRGLKPNKITYNKLLNGYCNNLKIDEAVAMYSSLYMIGDKPTHNMVAYYIVSMGRLSRARRKIQAAKPEIEFPFDHPYRYFLKHHDNTYEDALALFHFMDDNKLNSYIQVYNILIDGGSECGKFDTIRRLFHDLFVKGLQPDFETYTLMISGLSLGGMLKEAKQLIVSMEKSGFSPNSVNYNDLLRGYLKYKTFDDVLMLLTEMKGKGYRMTPPNFLVAMDQMIAREPDDILLQLARKAMPKNLRNIYEET